MVQFDRESRGIESLYDGSGSMLDEQTLQEAVQRIVAAVQLNRVILFGS